MMKLKNKKTGEICSSKEFNINTCCPQEIIVYGKDWINTNFMSDYDVEINEKWYDLIEAFSLKLLGVDNYNQYFGIKDNKYYMY